MASNNLTALITGGTSGIGRATARKMAQLGIHVLVVGRDEERGRKTVDEIRALGGKGDFVSSDLRNAASARLVAKRAIELGTGRVDILINNAGVFPFGPTHEMTEEQFDRVFSLNVKVPYFLVAELAPLMAKRGKGAIVNVSTMACLLRCAWDEPLRFEQGRHQSVDQNLGCGIWTKWRQGEDCESRTHTHGGHRGHG